MNSHPFSYECSSNYVVGNESSNEDIHQGFGNQGWEEPQAYEQPSWQQPPLDSYRYNPDPNVYQSNVCDDPHCGCQPQSSYAYDPIPQYSHTPYSQASHYHSTPFDHNSYTPYQPPYEPHLEQPPPSQYQYFQEPQIPHTPPHEFHQYEPPSNINNLPSNAESYLPPPPPLYHC